MILFESEDVLMNVMKIVVLLAFVAVMVASCYAVIDRCILPCLPSRRVDTVPDGERGSGELVEMQDWI
jgi:hypothetical protein